METIGGLLGFLISIPLYFLPTIIAFRRSLPNRKSIFVINFFLGITVFGWFLALGMSSAGKYRRIVDVGCVLLIMALLVAIAFPGMMKEKRAIGFAKARSNLHSISSALEEYAKNHGGQYPPDLATLKSGQPQAFPDVCGKEGTREDFYYTYECYLQPQGYLLLTNVKPNAPRSSDWRNLSVETGGVLRER